MSDRVRRAAEEQAARTLRLALHRRAVITAVLAAWPADSHRRTAPEWAALRALLPTGVSGAEVRNRTRQIRTYQGEHGHLPAGLCALEAPPTVAPQVLLAAVDRQQATLERLDATTAWLRVKLPLTAAPARPRQWAWHVIEVRLPSTIDPDAHLHPPTLRPTPGGRIAIDLPHSKPLTVAPAAGHTVALGFDWGVNTLLTGTLGRLTTRTGTGAGTGSGSGTARVVTDGRPLIFDATTISAKLHRLRTHREHLAAKRDRYQALAAHLGAPHRAWGHLLHQAAVLEVEHERVCARIRHLNRALAWAAAHWAVDQARALGATVIYLEDLATLEARGHRKGNARLSGQVRGTVAEAIRHLAAKAGITVATVPAAAPPPNAPNAWPPSPTTRPPTAWPSGAGSGRTAVAAACRWTATIVPPAGSSRAACSAKPTPPPTAPPGSAASAPPSRAPSPPCAALSAPPAAYAAPARPPPGPPRPPGPRPPWPKDTPPRPGPPRRSPLRPAEHRLPAVRPMCVRSPPPPPPGWSSVRRGMTPRPPPPLPGGRGQVMKYPSPTDPSLIGPAQDGSHAKPVDGAPAPPSGPASTTCTPPKSTPSPRGSDPTTATHGHAAPEKPEF